MTNVTVLGSGIAGLWTAHILSASGHNVAVISSSGYGNSTSAAAACVLVPLLPGDATSEAFQRGIRWSRETLQYMQSLDDRGRFLEQILCYEFGLQDMVEYSFDLTKIHYLDFSDIKTIRLGRIVAGCDVAIEFECYLCNSLIFLEWLHDTLTAKGVSFRMRQFTSLADVLALDTRFVFNCFGYQRIFSDPELYPVYGQSMYLPAEQQHGPFFGVGAGEHAVFKHKRGYHIGAYFIQHDANPGPREDLYRRSAEFIDGPFQALCESVGIDAPTLDLDRVSRVTAGVRPFRASGPRVELEQLGDKTIVHNYGHGAHGWTIGYGTSLEAVKLAGLAYPPFDDGGVLRRSAGS